MLVAELKKEDGSWNSLKVKELFFLNEAEDILSLPTSNFDSMDEQIWHYTNSGEYTVKSGYYISQNILFEEKKVHRAEGSDSNRRSRLWKNVWRMEIPQNIKSFVWRALNDIIPTNVNLWRRKVIDNFRCEECGEAESTLHALGGCNQWKGVFKSMGINLAELAQGGASFADGFDRLSISLRNPELEEVMARCWEVWKERNSRRNGKRARSIEMIIDRAMSQLNEYKKASVMFGPKEGKNPLPCIGWKKPGSSKVKVNIDGSYMPKSGEAGIGVVIRNDHGELMAALASPIYHVKEAIVAGCLALDRGIKLAFECGFEDIECESDCLSLVNYLSKCGETSLIRPIINNIKNRMSLFKQISFNF